MSYELCKNISLNEKKNEIKVTIASNNVYPKTYTTCELCKSEYKRFKNYTFQDKLIGLFSDLMDGNIQISTINDNTSNFEYALCKVYEYLKENNINSYTDLYEKRGELTTQKQFTYANLELSTNEDKWQANSENWKKYSEWRKTQNIEEIEEIENRFSLESLWEIYGKAFNIFKNALNEKIDGEYTILTYGAYYITKLGRYDRGYSRCYYGYGSPLKMSYKKAYIVLNNMNDETRRMKIEKIS